MIKKTQQRMLDEIKSNIYKQVVERWSRITASDIEDQVIRTIDKAAAEMIMLTVGLRRSSWGDRWEVDHANGYKSPVFQEISAIALQQLKEHMPEFLNDLRKNRVTIKKELADEYRDCYKRHAHNVIREYAVADADAEVKRLYELIKAEAENDNDESAGTGAGDDGRAVDGDA